MRKLAAAVVGFLFPNDTWFGHLFSFALYAGLVYAAYGMIMIWPLWRAVPMIVLQLALGYLSVPFLELIFPPPRKK